MVVVFLGIQMSCEEPPSKKQRVEVSRKQMDFSKYPTVHLAIRIMYHGQSHDGLARQENTTNTIEHILVAALVKVCLVPPTGPENFSRCGRTDKGVSAFGNVVALAARGAKEGSPALNYLRMLNKALPETVRVVGVAIVPPEFDARFSCASRESRLLNDKKRRKDQMPQGIWTLWQTGLRIPS